jgi:C_GCAxxG_C_C family probable redox protein
VGGHVEPEQKCFPRVATCFGGGIGRRGEICGALTGAVMVVGLAKGRGAGEGADVKERAYQLAEQIVEAFRHRFGDVRCRALIGVDLSDAAGQEAYRLKDIHNKFCVGYVAEAARLAYDAINV